MSLVTKAVYSSLLKWQSVDEMLIRIDGANLEFMVYKYYYFCRENCGSLPIVISEKSSNIGR